MKAELKDGKLVITLDFDKAGKISGSGKSRVHASTNGNKVTTVDVNGKYVVIGVNAYTPL